MKFSIFLFSLSIEINIIHRQKCNHGTIVKNYHIWSREMVHWVQCLPKMHKYLISMSTIQIKIKFSMVICTWNSSAEETEPSNPCSLPSLLCELQVNGGLCLQRRKALQEGCLKLFFDLHMHTDVHLHPMEHTHTHKLLLGVFFHVSKAIFPNLKKSNN